MISISPKSPKGITMAATAEQRDAAQKNSIFSLSKTLFIVRMFLFLLIFFLAGCARHHFNYCVEGAQEFVIESYQIREGKLAILEMEGECLFSLPEEAMWEYEDVISEDDILTVVLYHAKRKDLMEAIQLINQTIGFRVYEGTISFPDIPSIRVAGLTLSEARDKIQDVYREEIPEIDIFLSYRDRLSRKVDLTGLVAIPSVPVDGKIRLYEVLSRAHLPPEANLFTSYVEREGEKLPIDFHRLLVEGEMCQNIVMRGGDKIFIGSPRDGRALVMGEVLRPIPIEMPYGFISLREALVMAGGIPFTGNKNTIQVIRGGVVNPKIFVLSWKHITHLPNDSLLLIPGDTVYISETPITSWNRFISQLLPSFQGATSGNEAYQLFIP